MKPDLTVKEILIDQIFIPRRDRQRKELGDLEPLKNSIHRIGLLCPITVHQSESLPVYYLVAGERRLQSCIELGWTSIPARLLSNLTPIESQIVELEENIKRSDLPWEDQCHAVAKIHNHYCSTDPNWTRQKTAEILSVDPSTITRYLTTSAQLTSTTVPEVVKSQIRKPKTLKGAYSAVVRREARQKEKLINSLFQTPLEDEETMIVTLKNNSTILNIPFTEWVYQGCSFDLINVNTPDHFQKSTRFLSPSGAIIFWNEYLLQRDDNYEPIECKVSQIVWANSIPPKSTNSLRPISSFELGWLYWKGDLVKSLPDSYTCPSNPHDPLPEPMLRHFFSMVLRPGMTFFDPCCGTGASIRAAESLGATCLGLEPDPDLYQKAITALSNFRTLRDRS